MAIFINLLTISRMALGAFIFILLTRTEIILDALGGQ